MARVRREPNRVHTYLGSLAVIALTSVFSGRACFGQDGVDAGLAMRRLRTQRRCPSRVDATGPFQDGRFSPLRDGSDAGVAQDSIAHAVFDNAKFVSHFTRSSSPNLFYPAVPNFVSPSVSVSGVGWSDHEFVVVETRSSWLWGNKDFEYECSGQDWAAGLRESVLQMEDPVSEA